MKDFSCLLLILPTESDQLVVTERWLVRECICNRIYYIYYIYVHIPFTSNRTQKMVLVINLVSYLVILNNRFIIWTMMAHSHYISTILCHRNQYLPFHQPALKHLYKKDLEVMVPTCLGSVWWISCVCIMFCTFNCTFVIRYLTVIYFVHSL